MISILYEDKDIIVVEKPPGIESQRARGFEPDMVKFANISTNYPLTAEKLMWELSTDLISLLVELWFTQKIKRLQLP